MDEQLLIFALLGLSLLTSAFNVYSLHICRLDVKDMENDIKNARQTWSDYTHDVAAQFSGARDDIRKALAASEEARAKAARNGSDVDQILSSIEELRGAVDELSRKTDETASDLRDDMHDVTKELQEEISAAHSRMDTHASRLVSLESTSSAIDSMGQALDEAQREIWESIDAADHEIASLSSKLNKSKAASEEEWRSTEDKIEQAQRAIDRLSQDVSAGFQERDTAVKGVIEEMDILRSELSLANSNAAAAVDSAQKAQKEAQRAAEHRGSEEEAIHWQLSQHTTKLQAAEKAIRDLRDDIFNTQHDVESRIETFIAAVGSDVDEMTEKIGDLSGRIDAVEDGSEVQLLKEAMRHFEDELVRTLGAVDSVKSLPAAVTALQAELSEATNEAGKQAEAFYGVLNTITERVDELDRKVAREAGSSINHAREIAGLRNDIKLDDDIVDDIESRLADLHGRIDDEASALSARLNELAFSAAETKAAATNLGERVATLEARPVQGETPKELVDRIEQLSGRVDDISNTSTELLRRDEQLAGLIDGIAAQRLPQFEKAFEQVDQALTSLREDFAAATHDDVRKSLAGALQRLDGMAGDIRELADGVKDHGERIDDQGGEMKSQITLLSSSFSKERENTAQAIEAIEGRLSEAIRSIDEAKLAYRDQKASIKLIAGSLKDHLSALAGQLTNQGLELTTLPEIREA